MKTISKAKKENPDYKDLIDAVIAQLGYEEDEDSEELQGILSDIMNYGISGGFSGFTYNSDTHEFAMKYRKQIIKRLEEQAEEFGQEIIEMISHFGHFKSNKIDSEDKKELYAYIGGGPCEQSSMTNLMAWFAAEEVARMFE